VSFVAATLLSVRHRHRARVEGPRRESETRQSAPIEPTFSAEVDDLADGHRLPAASRHAAKLYETDRVSLGKAAEIAELFQSASMDLLGKLRVPVIAYPADDLDREE
jgi:hypothetical protein